MLVLFDLQEELKELESGQLPENPYFGMYGATQLSIVNVASTKTIHVAGKTDLKPGLMVNTQVMSALLPGDRITVTGRLGSGAPRSDWAMVIDRHTSIYGHEGLAQHITPKHNELFSITYLLEADDLEKPLLVRTNHWGTAEESMDYYIDSVLITRNIKNTDADTEERKEIYTLAGDTNFVKLRPGGVTRYIKACGTPKFTITESNGKKGIRVERRLNNWDGLDLWLENMNLKKGNSYTITVNGKIEGIAAEKSRMMFQMLPGYIWKSVRDVVSDQEFTLTHTLSAMELQNTEAVRIATNEEGATMSFFIRSIEVTANQREI
ncbi:MAG: hypothetical protein FWF81_03520 [Defluviitaleaceae bacterium]|nr:hypothetical protein [Defluviitaleaceae bacterium]